MLLVQLLALLLITPNLLVARKNVSKNSVQNTSTLNPIKENRSTSENPGQSDVKVPNEICEEIPGNKLLCSSDSDDIFTRKMIKVECKEGYDFEI